MGGPYIPRTSQQIVVQALSGGRETSILDRLRLAQLTPSDVTLTSGDAVLLVQLIRHVQSLRLQSATARVALAEALAPVTGSKP